MHPKSTFIKIVVCLVFVLAYSIGITAQNNNSLQQANDTVFVTDTVLVSKYGEIKKPLFGTTIKRWNETKKEPYNKSIPLQIKSNIFDDYAWTKPPFTAIFLETDEQYNASFKWKNNNYVLNTNDSILSITAPEGKIIIGSNQKSTNLYFDAKHLTKGKKEVEQWIYKTVYKKLYYPEVSKVANSIEQRNEKGEYNTTTYYTYITNYTVKYEPTTNWVYKAAPSESNIIPSYDITVFNMGNNEQLIIYKVMEDSSISYYLQNPSYISATDNENVNHIIVDLNANGCYFDNEDIIYFNTWNPYSRNSKYKQEKQIKENEWFTFEYLNQNFFLQYSANSDFTQVLCKNENDEYLKSNKKGCVQFHKLPVGAEIYINGTLYDIGEKITRSEYGRFNTIIKAKGSLDYQRTYRLDDKRPYRHITYKPQDPAGTVELNNTKSSVFVEVSNKDAYFKQHINSTKISVPIGKIRLRILSNEIQINIDTVINRWEVIKIDLKKEFEKTLSMSDSLEVDTVEVNKQIIYYRDTNFVNTIVNQPTTKKPKAERRIALSSFTNCWFGLDYAIQQTRVGTRFGIGYNNSISKPMILRYQNSIDYTLFSSPLKFKTQFGGNIYIPTKWSGYPVDMENLGYNDLTFSPFIGTGLSYNFKKFVIEASGQVSITNYWEKMPVKSGLSSRNAFWSSGSYDILNVLMRYEYGVTLYYRF